jgi:hypothetical protein
LHGAPLRAGARRRDFRRHRDRGRHAAAREYWKTLEPATRGFYINEVGGDEGAARLDANCLGNHPRLAQVKRRYDPTNLFRLNANVTPTA